MLFKEDLEEPFELLREAIRRGNMSSMSVEMREQGQI